MRLTAYVLALALMTGAASASRIEDTTGLTYQDDGGSGADAADLCDTASIVVAVGDHVHGFAIPHEDPADYYLLNITTEDVGTVIDVSLMSNSVELRLDVFKPACTQNVVLQEDPICADGACETKQFEPKHDKSKGHHCGHSSKGANNWKCLDTEGGVRNEDGSVTFTPSGEGLYVIAVVITLQTEVSPPQVQLSCHNFCDQVTQQGGYLLEIAGRLR